MTPETPFKLTRKHYLVCALLVAIPLLFPIYQKHNRINEANEQLSYAKQSLERKDYSSAVQQLQTALALSERYYPAMGSDVLSIKNNLAAAYRNNDQLSEAITLLVSTLKSLSSISNDNSKIIVALSLNLGNMPTHSSAESKQIVDTLSHVVSLFPNSSEQQKLILTYINRIEKNKGGK